MDTPKPGWKSTEFLFTAVVNILGVLTMFGVFDPNVCAAEWCPWALRVLAMLVMLLKNLGYEYGRSRLKASVANADAPKP